MTGVFEGSEGSGELTSSHYSYLMKSIERFETEMTLEAFWIYLITRVGVAPQLKENGCQRLQSLTKINPKSILFYEQYGCALILSDPSFGVSRSPQVAVTMIALDNWTFSCTERKDSNYVMTSLCNDYSALPVGTINLNEVTKIFKRFNQDLGETLKPQKTPGFILSILERACDDLELQDSCPGFTDVGGHSGKVPKRDTRWSLVKSITKHSDQPIPSLFPIRSIRSLKSLFLHFISSKHRIFCHLFRVILSPKLTK
jgi:hypothetical protein